MAASRNLVVGIFVVLALVILTVVTVSLRHWDLLSGRKTYYVRFKEVKALDVGAPVFVSGVQAGQVTNLDYESGDFPVLATLRLKGSVVLYENAEVRVTPAAVIGNTTINIRAGSGTRKVLPGSTLIGRETPDVEETVQRVSAEMSNALRGVSAILNDPQNQANVKKLVANTTVLADKMSQTFSMINKDFKPVLDDLRRTMENANQLLQQAQKVTEATSGEIGKTAESFRDAAGEYRATAKALAGEIHAVANRLQATIDQLQKTIRTNEDPLSRALKEFAESSRAFREVLQRVENGRGTLGKLINDPRPFDQLRQILEGISQTLTGRREALFPMEGSAGASSSPAEPAHP